MNNPDFDLLHYETIDSTNEEAKRLLSDGRIRNLTAIVADAQTAGKGTQGRRWVSPPRAGLYLSIVHPFENALAERIPMTAMFTLAAGVACAETLRELATLPVQLKPVNDLYVHGKKLGGILTESLIQESRFKALITGIGINLHPCEITLEGNDRRGIEPISLRECLPDEAAAYPGVEVLVPKLVAAVDFWHQQAFSGNASFLMEHYMNYKLPEFDLPEVLA